MEHLRQYLDDAAEGVAVAAGAVRRPLPFLLAALATDFKDASRYLHADLSQERFRDRPCRDLHRGLPCAGRSSASRVSLWPYLSTPASPHVPVGEA